MMKKNNNAKVIETRLLGSISSSSIRNLLPRSISSKHRSTANPKIYTSNAENTAPLDPNIIQINDEHSLSTSTKQCKSETPNFQNAIPESNTPLDSPAPQGGSSVKVVVRIKPVTNNGREGDGAIKKVSSNTLCVGDRQFAFDSVFDSNCDQEDIFQSVGVPLVKNALAGYNTSLLSYGQSGSGKTYTMWGPPSAMVEEPSPSSHQGIAPRIFQMLFSELEREQRISEGKQFNYQCRCSFLEVYNGQIGDLLDQTQRNLEMKDDSKNATYVENLTEEYVTSYDDVTQILIKGLSSRKVGATSLNSKSSRSHIVFTLVIESWCKGTASKGFCSSKSSRISLIDLAGLDRSKVDDAGKRSVRESKNVKKSLSQLGRFVDALTKETPAGKDEDISGRNSCLTRLLRESLGGNAKLSVICSISTDNRSNGETLRTLRFGQRARSIRNEPVINEIKEDDVNDLSDQIRQLKEELIRAKADACSSVGSKREYFQGRNVRVSLNLLRVSLNRSLLLSQIDDDTDEKVNINEDDVRQLRQQIDELNSSCGGYPKDTSVDGDFVQLSSAEENCDTDMIIGDEFDKEEDYSEKPLSKSCHEDSVASSYNLGCTDDTSKAVKSPFRNSISVSSCSKSPLPDEPLLSESPKIRNTQRKSMAISSSHLGSWKTLSESSNFGEEVLGQSFKKEEHIRSSLQSRGLSGPTESLAASLQRGLQIIDYHQRNSALSKSSASFSFEQLTSCPEVDKIDPSDHEAYAICISCKRKISDPDSTVVRDSLKSWIFAIEAENPDRLTDRIPKHLESVMTKAMKREKELEDLCKEQAAKIEQLNELVEKCKGNRELNSFVAHGGENKQAEPEEGNCEIKEVHEEVAQRDKSFDANEKEALLKEIQNLRSNFQLCGGSPARKSTEKLRHSLLSKSIQLRKSSVFSHDNGGEELEKERERWTEIESEWICLTDELRVDLEAHRQRAERVEMELRLEKKCTEELDDALKRSVLGHARMVEHYAELQEKYNELVTKHNAIMEGIAEVKKAAAKAGKKGHARFAKSLAAELSALRVEREREREFLKRENKNLKIQLRDTAEAVHAAGELLLRLREAEHAASVAEENFAKIQIDNEKMKKQMEKLKRKHKMEMITMKQYLAESKLPESALKPLYREDYDVAQNNAIPNPDDDQAWRAEFGAIYQDHHY